MTDLPLVSRCPFCGADANRTEVWSGQPKAHISCQECPAEMEVSIPCSDVGQMKRDMRVALKRVTESWNRNCNGQFRDHRYYLTKIEVRDEAIAKLHEQVNKLKADLEDSNNALLERIAAEDRAAS